MSATIALTGHRALTQAAGATTRAAQRVAIKPQAATFYRWKPVRQWRGGVSPAPAGSCQELNCSSDALRQSWGDWGSVLREFEEGATGLLDPSPFTRYRRAASRREATRPIPFDAFDYPDKFLLQFDLPGVARSDIQLKVSPDGVLTVSVDRQAPNSNGTPAISEAETPASPTEQAVAEDQGAVPVEGASGAAPAKGPAAEEAQEQAAPQQVVVRLERPYGRFVRSIKLPKSVEADGIAAKLADGVLTLTLPKTAQQPPAMVSIQVE